MTKDGRGLCWKSSSVEVCPWRCIIPLAPPSYQNILPHLRHQGPTWLLLRPLKIRVTVVYPPPKLFPLNIFHGHQKGASTFILEKKKLFRLLVFCIVLSIWFITVWSLVSFSLVILGLVCSTLSNLLTYTIKLFEDVLLFWYRYLFSVRIYLSGGVHL